MKKEQFYELQRSILWTADNLRCCACFKQTRGAHSCVNFSRRVYILYVMSDEITEGLWFQNNHLFV